MEGLLGRQVTAGFHAVSQVVAQTTAVVAVLYYFGWARSNALFSYFGIDPAMARWSVTDYALRSVNVVVRPLVIVGMIVLGLIVVHRALSRVLGRHAAAGRRVLPRVITTSCGAAGLLLCATGLLGFYDVIVYSRDYPVVPILLAAGITLALYAIHLAGLIGDPPAHGEEPGTDPESRGAGMSALTVVLFALAGALTLWTVAVYAGIDGRHGAQRILNGLNSRTAVVVYSKSDLGLSAPGLGIERLAGRGEYQFRYSGLRLLIYSGGRYILLPDRWVRHQYPAFILDERDGLRFELR